MGVFLTAAKSFVTARAFPYLVIVFLSSTAAAYGYGRFTGYNSGEQTMLLEMETALTRQHKRVVKMVTREGELALEKERKKNAITVRIREVPVPNTSCELPTQCLQWHDDVLRAARAHQ